MARGIAGKIGTAVATEFSHTPIRSTAALATSSFFLGAAALQLKGNKPATDTGNTGVKIDEVKHPDPTKE